MDGDIAEVVNAMVKNIDGVVKGKHHEIRMAMCCMLTEGHLLIDDVPGTGKTTLAKAIAGSIAGTLEARPVHARPAPERHHRRDGVRAGQRQLPLP